MTSFTASLTSSSSIIAATAVPIVSCSDTRCRSLSEFMHYVDDMEALYLRESFNASLCSSAIQLVRSIGGAYLDPVSGASADRRFAL